MIPISYSKIVDICQDEMSLILSLVVPYVKIIVDLIIKEYLRKKAKTLDEQIFVCYVYNRLDIMSRYCAVKKRRRT